MYHVFKYAITCGAGRWNCIVWTQMKDGVSWLYLVVVFFTCTYSDTSVCRVKADRWLCPWRVRALPLQKSNKGLVHAAGVWLNIDCSHGICCVHTSAQVAMVTVHSPRTVDKDVFHFFFCGVIPLISLRYPIQTTTASRLKTHRW